MSHGKGNKTSQYKKKTTTFKNTPLKVLKFSPHNCSKTLKKLFSDTMNNSEFPDGLKLAEVTATFGKDDPNIIDLWVFY